MGWGRHRGSIRLRAGYSTNTVPRRAVDISVAQRRRVAITRGWVSSPPWAPAQTGSSMPLLAGKSGIRQLDIAMQSAWVCESAHLFSSSRPSGFTPSTLSQAEGLNFREGSSLSQTERVSHLTIVAAREAASHGRVAHREGQTVLFMRSWSAAVVDLGPDGAGFDGETFGHQVDLLPGFAHEGLIIVVFFVFHS